MRWAAPTLRKIVKMHKLEDEEDWKSSKQMAKVAPTTIPNLCNMGAIPRGS
jgi:hypothetical protein